MKIGLFLSSLSLVRGGLETVATGLASGLADAGHQVTCVGGGWSRRSLPPDLAALPVRWLRVPCLPARSFGINRRSLRARKLILQSYSFISACRLLPESRRLLHEADVTLSFLEVETVLLSNWRAQRNRPHVSYFPGGINWRWLRRDCSVVRVATSRTIADTYASIADFSIDGVVTPGTDAALLQQPYTVRPRASRLLFVGRLEQNKGVRELLQIFAALAPDFPDLMLTILGDGPLRRDLQATAAAASWGKRVIFAGAVPPQAVQEALRQSDLFVFPTHYESFGIVVIEAQMAGVPVVCSQMPIMQEVTDSHAALLPIDNQPQWVETIRALLDDKEARRQMSEAGREHARRFTWDQVAQMLEPYLYLALQRCGDGR